MSFVHDGSSTTFKVPYGGLIYVSPTASNALASAEFRFDNVLKASYWKNGQWQHPLNTDVPLADIDTGHFIYTTPVKNVTDSDHVMEFTAQMNRFANAASDFYGRDQTPTSLEEQGASSFYL